MTVDQLYDALRAVIVSAPRPRGHLPIETLEAGTLRPALTPTDLIVEGDRVVLVLEPTNQATRRTS